MVRTLQATDDFEVTWDDPSAADQRWTYDREHTHGTMTRFELEAESVAVEVAHSQQLFAVNGRSFSGTPTMPAPPREIRSKSYAELWDEIYLAEAIAPTRAVLERDDTALTDAELAAVILDDLRSTGMGLRATQSPVFKMFVQLYPFSEFCREQFGDPDGLLMQYRMLQGRETETTEAALGLERLAVAIEDDAPLIEALAAGEIKAARTDAAHAEFFAAFDVYLERYGWRAMIWTDLSTPTWAEQPDIPIAMIVRYARSPETRPSAGLAAAAEDREAAIVEALERLPDDAARATLRQHLDEHEHYPRVREGRAHWQLILSGCVRRPLLELGRRLVARDLLDHPEDVLHLETDELVALEAGEIDGRALVEQHRVDYDHWRTLEPPDFIGSGEAGPNPLERLEQPTPGERISADGKLISGTAASMGIVHGRARVITDLTDADRLQPGEVLVCRTTAPPWTPLFGVASAVVTDGGGVLSHSAIVAREYRIPAVVGTNLATSTIPDGAMITVDGSAGTVRID